jgi:hypothetical protein
MVSTKRHNLASMPDQASSNQQRALLSDFETLARKFNGGDLRTPLL